MEPYFRQRSDIDTNLLIDIDSALNRTRKMTIQKGPVYRQSSEMHLFDHRCMVAIRRRGISDLMGTYGTTYFL